MTDNRITLLHLWSTVHPRDFVRRVEDLLNDLYERVEKLEAQVNAASDNELLSRPMGPSTDKAERPRDTFADFIASQNDLRASIDAMRDYCRKQREARGEKATKKGKKR